MSGWLKPYNMSTLRGIFAVLAGFVASVILTLQLMVSLAYIG